MSWNVVIPVKSLDAAKSRLRRDRSGVADLALAFALDTLSAVRNSRGAGTVIVVTSDARVRAASPAGTLFVDDPGLGLNTAVAAGLHGAGPGKVAVVTADLPGLTAEEFDTVLADAGRHERAMVADHSGHGTTMLTSLGGLIVPQFGPGSRWRHEQQGHVVLPVPQASALRRDIDTAEDLAAALRNPLGPETLKTLAAAATGPAGSAVETG